jgi:hypothetical protein
MFSSILSWTIKQVGGDLLEGVLSKLSGDQAAIEAIRADSAAKRNSEEVRKATSGFWEMRLITALIAGSFTLHLCAVTLDTVFKLGLAVPKYPAPFDQWEATILLSFFAVQAWSHTVRSLVGALLKK